MAIARVNIPTPTAPVGVADYQAQLDQITALNQAFTGRNPVDGSMIRAGAVMMVGSVLYKATSDTAITGTPSLYVKITPAGATASASFVASLSGVTWNHAYGGYYDGSGNLYLFDEGIAVASGVVTSPMTQIGRSAGPRKRTFTSSGTFVVPTDVTEVWVTGCAAGGNGGAGSGPSAAGGGGGGQGAFVIKKSIAVTPGASISVTIGSVGANTTFGGLLTLPFGVSGGAASGTTGGGQGDGSAGSGASYGPGVGNPAGMKGGSGGGVSTSSGGGGGAQSPLDSASPGSAGSSGGGSGASGGAGGLCGGGGGGGGSGASGAGGAGGAANAYGAGGGGGGGGTTTGGAGGAGGPGILIVEW